MSEAAAKMGAQPAGKTSAWQRVGTALVLAPVALAAVWLAPGAWFAVLTALVAALAAAEFFQIAAVAGLRPYSRLGVVLAGGVALALGWPGVGWLALAVVIATVAVLLRALADERMVGSFADAGTTLLGTMYLGLGMGAVAAVRGFFSGQIQGAAWVTLLLAVVWAGDVAALYAGKAWGHSQMAPQASPKKTWVGAAASLIAAAVVGGVAGGRWPEMFGSWWGTALLGVTVNVAAQAGDLVESVFKRGAGVKDSGGLLPGHGGVLDRIDALLLAAPALWVWLALWR